MFFTTNSSVTLTRPIISTTKNPVQPQPQPPININNRLADTSKKNTFDLAKDMRFGMISRVQGRTECFSCR